MEGVVRVKLFGTLIGYLGYEPVQKEVATFEYDDSFLKMKISPSPLKLPLNISPYSFEDISHRTFHGVPGFIADSLPDRFGNQLIDQFFADKGVKSEDVTTLDRLLYVGNRAMGALEYEPSEVFSKDTKGLKLDLNTLSELAEMVLTNKEQFRDELHYTSREDALNLLRIGSSAGGARSKALVAMDSDGSLYDGTVEQSFACNYYLLKFDSSSNSDRENKDPKGMTRVEYIYSLIARKCNIDIPKTKYIEIGDDFHYLIERFDRVKTDNGKIQKLHYVSWSGLDHAHRDIAGAYSYEQLVLVARAMQLGQDSIIEIFKRAVFNIVGRNQDDHTKNFGFLMDRKGEWKLAPAFDLTYSFDPTGKWTKVHQIRLNSKQDGFSIEDIVSFAQLCNINEHKAKEILSNTIKSFKEFTVYADKYQVDNALKETVSNNLRLAFVK